MALVARIQTAQCMKDIPIKFHVSKNTSRLNFVFSNNAKSQLNKVTLRPFATVLSCEVPNFSKQVGLLSSNVNYVLRNSDKSVLRHCARCYSTLPSRYQSKRGKQEQEPRDEDTLLYTYEDQRRYKSIVACGFTIAVVLFGEGLLVIYDSDPNKIAPRASKDAAAIERFKAFGRRNKFYFLGTAYLLIGVTMCYLMPMYVGRSVTELRLLKCGEKLQITTYSVIGPKKQVVVPLIETDFKTPRHVKGANLSFAVKGKRLLYMIDKKNGVFHQPNVFDMEVCMKRNY